jgi:hypothetical protein
MWPLVWSALQIPDQGIWRTVVGEGRITFYYACVEPLKLANGSFHCECKKEKGKGGEGEMARGQTDRRDIYPKEEHYSSIGHMMLGEWQQARRVSDLSVTTAV